MLSQTDVALSPGSLLLRQNPSNILNSLTLSQVHLDLDHPFLFILLLHHLLLLVRPLGVSEGHEIGRCPGSAKSQALPILCSDIESFLASHEILKGVPLAFRILYKCLSVAGCMLSSGARVPLHSELPKILSLCPNTPF